MTQKSNPVAVLISDVHFNINTIELATAAMRQAIAKAEELNVPLIIAGDLHDTKAMLRGECIEALIDLFDGAWVSTYILVGNHDKINEKSENNSLEFLKPYVEIIRSPVYDDVTKLWLLPYFSDLTDLKTALEKIPKGSTIIMHQGVTKAHGGHYMHDKTAAPAEWFKYYRVISGHYHRRQEVVCGGPYNSENMVGLFSYIGNPYTLTFGEAEDPEKGFQILMDDGTLKFVPCGLRKHIVSEWNYADLCDSDFNGIRREDLAWVKIKGTRSELSTLTKQYIGQNMAIDPNFKLDLIPIDDKKSESCMHDKFNDREVLHKLINETNESDEQKAYLLDLVEGLLK